ncbi:MAG: 50S ribosomal protein L10 [Verrucomicrobiota bacterium]
MRPEKELLVSDVDGHLDKSDYVFLTNYESITVEETESLRELLAAESAEFHVVKNSILNLALRRREKPDLKEHLSGPTAIIVGGENPSGVAKVLKKFFEDKEKVEMKVGILGDQAFSAEDLVKLADLPGLEELQAKFLSLLNTPAQRFVSVVNAVPQSVVNLLKAKADQGGAN